MAAADVLIYPSSIKGSTLSGPSMTSQRKLELRMPDHGIIGQRPREFDQFRLEKTYSHGNLGLSSATAYQSIHAPQPRIMQPVLPSSYKHHTSSRYRLPNLLQRSSSKKFHRAPHWRSSVPSTSILYATPSQLNENKIPLRPHTSAGKIIDYTSSPINWTPAHANMSATGQALLSESYKNRTFYRASLPGKNSTSPGTHLPHHTIVNYVPFYEPRTRGDGSSEVDASANDRKVPKPSSLDNDGNANKEAAAATKREIRAPSALKNSRPESPEWPGSNGKQPPGTRGRQEKKRVRFSSTVTDKMEEPAYVETLLLSVSKKLQTGVKEGWALPVEEDARKPTAKPNAHLEAASTVGDDDDFANFVTPITRVTVTRRKVGEQKEATSEQGTSTGLSSSAAKNISQQQIQDMATKILNNSPSAVGNSVTPKQPETIANDKLEAIPSPSRSPTRNVTGFVTARAVRRGEILPMSKYLQKKQAVIAPSFPEQPPKTRNTFMSYATRLNRNETLRKHNYKNEPNPNQQASNMTTATPVRRAASVTYRQKAPASAQPSKQLVQYVSIDLKINNLAPPPKTTPRVAPEVESPARNMFLLPSQATHFQPIPSMPDHINFCDPRKTEHILDWLDDVNKKRNIDTKLKRVSSSMSSKTIS